MKYNYCSDCTHSVIAGRWPDNHLCGQAAATKGTTLLTTRTARAQGGVCGPAAKLYSPTPKRTWRTLWLR